MKEFTKFGLVLGVLVAALVAAPAPAEARTNTAGQVYSVRTLSETAAAGTALKYVHLKTQVETDRLPEVYSEPTGTVMGPSWKDHYRNGWRTTTMPDRIPDGMEVLASRWEQHPSIFDAAIRVDVYGSISDRLERERLEREQAEADAAKDQENRARAENERVAALPCIVDLVKRIAALEKTAGGVNP